MRALSPRALETGCLCAGGECTPESHRARLAFPAHASPLHGLLNRTLFEVNADQFQGGICKVVKGFDEVQYIEEGV